MTPRFPPSKWPTSCVEFEGDAMGRAVLFLNGEMNDYEWHRRQLCPEDDRIAVDGGGRHCLAMGLVPHLAVGDFDSMSREVARFYRENDVPMVSFPADKDYTDFVLAIEASLERGATEILVFGGLGGPRLDMELGNIFALVPFCGRAEIALVSEISRVRIVRAGDCITIKGNEGEYLSLLALTNPFITAPSRNLKYQLEELSFTVGETRGISNEICRGEAEVTVKEGMAILICQKKVGV